MIKFLVVKAGRLAFVIFVSTSHELQALTSFFLEPSRQKRIVHKIVDNSDH